MTTAIDSSIPEDSPQEEIHDVYEKVISGFSHAKEDEKAEHLVSSPYSNIQDPNDLAFTQRLSSWSPQPTSPSSVNTASRSLFTSHAPTPPPIPPPIPPPLPGPSSSGRPWRPLPRPPTASNVSFSPVPSTSVPTHIDPYPLVRVSSQPSDSKYRETLENYVESSPVSDLPPSSEVNGQPTDSDGDITDDENDGTRYDIDDLGEGMLPLPPYSQNVEPGLTLEVGPPPDTQSLSLTESNLAGVASERMTFSGSERRNLSFVPSDPGPSNYRDHRSFGGGNSYDDHGSSAVFDELYGRDYYDDFYPVEHRVSQGPSLGRRNSRFILVGRIPSDFDSGIRHNVDSIEDDEASGHWDEPSEDDANFINYSFLSNLAMLLRDKVPRDRHTKGRITYPNSFTGKDIVTTIHYQIYRELKENHGASADDRRPALLVARSLQTQLFFYEVEWGSRVLQDGVGDVYMFLDDSQENSERAEIPTGVVTVLSKCYSPSCGEFNDSYCYSYSCPRRGLKQLPPATEALLGPTQDPWPVSVPQGLLRSLTEFEINRQTIIHKLLSKEEQYVHDLDLVESAFIEPLRDSGIQVSSGSLQEFVDEIFGNITQIRDINKRLLESLYVRQREQAPIVKEIGDIFLIAATNDFREVYPPYIGHQPIAERLLREELERNSAFRMFIENCSRRQVIRLGQSPRLDLKHFLNRPVEHLQKYRVLLEAIYKETDQENPDGGFLAEAIKALNKLQNLSQVHTFQETVMKGSMKKWEWSDLVTPSERQYFSREEAQRQSIIFELIATEMDYVKDLHNIDKMFITPLREADPSIIPRDRLPQFLNEVFSNIQDITHHHQRLVDRLHYIQREHHPQIPSITAAVFGTALDFRETYLKYIPNYPIAAYRIEDERENNAAFRDFHDDAIRHPSARRLPMNHFIYRPIPRLLRYELLLKGILDASPPGHEDRSAIPQVIETLKLLGKDTEPGVASSKQKVDLWKYNNLILFKPGEHFDMDLLNDSRSLIHSGKLYRQPEGGGAIGRGDWAELFVILFDNYLVMTKAKPKDDSIEYHVTRRPIPLDLLSLIKFEEPPIQRPTSLLRTRRNDRTATSPTGSNPIRSDSVDCNLLYPFVIHHTGRLGGQCVLYAESASVRTEWQRKLEETLGLRKVVMESNKMFEMETLSQETFLLPAFPATQVVTTWNDTTTLGGKVTCSVPFTTRDNRKLVAIACAEGVWMGFLHDPRSMRRVLHLRNVTQCAMLEDFGLFLVLADKTLFAYHIEALVPTQPYGPLMQDDYQRLNSAGKDVQFFSVGTMYNRTLVIYMKKSRGSESIFHALEPVADKIGERPKTSTGITSIFTKNKSGWFRTYKEFSLTGECYDLIFLKARIAILCQKGFEIMQIESLSSVTIPVTQDSRLATRCGSARPLGMFRVNDDEFILCYDEFGLFVNKHGDPSRKSSTVEWEGIADRVALHAPYILLFDSRFIEVRHVDTGRLAQIIPGTDVRCVWDGRGVDQSPALMMAAGPDENMSQEPKVHAVMSVSSELQYQSRNNRGMYQRVFELVPTIPLYLPDPIASPPAATHFLHPSFSPPRSPVSRTGGSSSYRS